MQQQQMPKEKNIPNKTCPVLTCPPRHRCYLETVSCVGTLPRANHYQPLSALRQLPGGVTPACARCELSQPVAMLHLVKSPRSFFLPKKKKKKEIPIHSWGRRRRRRRTQHNCLSSGESYCAYFHLSVTYDGTALQVEIGPLTLG